MKSFGGLWNRVTEMESLYLAYRRARRGKWQSGAAMAFAYDLESQLARLRSELVNGNYRPSGYRHFSIRDPKPRVIYAAAFRDRVVHHSLVAAIEPIFERRMIYDSYACRVSKGAHVALHRLDRFWRRCAAVGPVYVMRMDISKYFFNIDHGRLLAMTNCYFREPEMRNLNELIVRSLSTGDRPGVGIPIGNLTSQIFANVYLDQLDHFAKERLGIPWYLRYMDDVAVFANDKAMLWTWLGEMRQFIEQRLALRLNPRRTQIFPAADGVPWLGFRVTAPGRRRVARATVLRGARRLRGLATAYRAGEIGGQAVRDWMVSWAAHLKYGDTWRLRSSLFNSVEWTAA